VLDIAAPTVDAPGWWDIRENPRWFCGFHFSICGVETTSGKRRHLRVAVMSTESSNSGSRPREDRNIYRDLRERNERRLDAARILEARRLRQIERVVQTVRERRFWRPDK
jgi:hypothetical protein